MEGSFVLTKIGDEMYNSLEICTRKYRGKQYYKVFLGSDAVAWLIQNGYAKDVDDALELGNRIMEHGAFVHCVRDHKLKNEALFYRFLRDEQNKGKVPENVAEDGRTWANVLKDHHGKVLDSEFFESNPQIAQQTDLHMKNTEVPEILIDQLNADLLDLVRPIKWLDPEPEGKYNIVAIGAGAGGLVSALGCCSIGGKAAICEKSYFGGDCLVTGCVPSKALIRAAKAAHEVRNAARFGIKVSDFEIDFSEVMKSVKKKRTKIGHHDSCNRFIKTYGVDIYLGTAKFSSKDTISINGKELKFARAVIATGGSPRVPKVPGIDGVRWYTSETIFNLEKRPESMVVLGGGPIGAEIGQSFGRLGSKVTVLIRSGKFMPKEDREAARIVEDKMKQEGVVFKKNFKVLEIQAADTMAMSEDMEEPGDDRGVQGSHTKPNRCIIKVQYTETGELEEIFCDCLFLAIGRVPNVQNLGLDVAGVEYDLNQGVKISDTMRTTNSNIYAVGDCCSPLQFTHMADAMARGVLRNSLLFGSIKHTKMLVPRVTYTDPEVAQVGKNAEDLDQAKVKYEEIMIKMGKRSGLIIRGQ